MDAIRITSEITLDVGLRWWHPMQLGILVDKCQVLALFFGKGDHNVFDENP